MVTNPTLTIQQFFYVAHTIHDMQVIIYHLGNNNATQYIQGTPRR